MIKTFVRDSKRQIIYTGIIAFIVFIIPLIFDWFGAETINLLILPYIVNSITKLSMIAGLGAQLLTFLIGWIIFFIIALIIKKTRSIE